MTDRAQDGSVPPDPDRLAAALERFGRAKDEVRAAWDEVRLAQGDELDHPCRPCKGTGRKPSTLALLRGDPNPEERPCPHCRGVGHKRHSFPWVVTGVDWTHFKALRPPLFETVGWVKVRPCGKEYGGKTYLGWLLGDLALMPGASLRPDGTLELLSGGNPAIFVPALCKVIYGAESWWATVESPDDLRDITDATLDNVWYVQALRAMAERPEGPPSNDPEPDPS
jgi:hypothetical protein